MKYLILILFIASGCSSQPAESINVSDHAEDIIQEALYIESISQDPEIHRSTKEIVRDAKEISSKQSEINEVVDKNVKLTDEINSKASNTWLWISILSGIMLAASVGLGIYLGPKIGIPLGISAAVLLGVSLVIPTMIWLMQWIIIGGVVLCVAALIYIIWVNRKDIHKAADKII